MNTYEAMAALYNRVALSYIARCTFFVQDGIHRVVSPNVRTGEMNIAKLSPVP